MNVFYEEDGGFKAGNVLADQGASLQVESASGKRSKVKSAHVLFDFEGPDATTLMRDAQALADTIDLAFLWECAPQGEFSFKDLAADYFGRAATPVESAALVTRLHSAPMYFYRKGRGHYRSAPPEALRAALAGVERKQREAALQASLAEELAAGALPDAIRAHARELAFRPDRGRVEWKALADAAATRRTTPERLLLAVGAFATPAALHRERFAFTHFPRGTGFPDVAIPGAGDLPRADVAAFSIDDADTTEIDDAFSVVSTGDGAWRIGIHIAAPGLAIARDTPLDAIARERASTVYAPGEKITMLPDAAIAAFTLAAGRDCPALSLYVDTVEEDGAWRIASSTSRAERVPIVANLRHHELDDVATEARLADGVGEHPQHGALAVLWRFARAQHAKRQEARVAAGLKPEGPQRGDYSFRVTGTAEGAERIAIVERRRGSPVDTIVAELMILANATWGRLLADHGTAGIYRAQSAAFGPAGRVRMVTHPAPHAGLGVAQYAWSTSPLRRYVDLLNQRQIASAIAGMPPPFAPKDAELFAIVSGFDAAYGAYADYQSRMERYWCLRWLAQEGRTRVEARATGRDDHAMLVDVPLLVRAPGLVVGRPGGSQGENAVVRGQHVEVEILATDLVDLSVACRLAAIIEDVDESEMDENEMDESEMDGNDGAREAARGDAAGTSAAADVETAAAEAGAA